VPADTAGAAGGVAHPSSKRMTDSAAAKTRQPPWRLDSNQANMLKLLDPN